MTSRSSFAKASCLLQNLFAHLEGIIHRAQFAHINLKANAAQVDLEYFLKTKNHCKDRDRIQSQLFLEMSFPGNRGLLEFPRHRLDNERQHLGLKLAIGIHLCTPFMCLTGRGITYDSRLEMLSYPFS